MWERKSPLHCTRWRDPEEYQPVVTRSRFCTVIRPALFPHSPAKARKAGWEVVTKGWWAVSGQAPPHPAVPETNCANATVPSSSEIPALLLDRKFGIPLEDTVDVYVRVCVSGHACVCMCVVKTFAKQWLTWVSSTADGFLPSPVSMYSRMENARKSRPPVQSSARNLSSLSFQLFFLNIL